MEKSSAYNLLVYTRIHEHVWEIDRFDGIYRQFETIDKRFKAMDQRLDAIDMRLERVEKDVSNLKVGQQLIKKELYMISKQVGMAYDLALENWGTIEESKKRISVLEGCV